MAYVDTSGYMYFVQPDADLGTPSTSVQFEPPGETDVLVPLSGTVTVTNETVGRQAPAPVGAGGSMGVVALFDQSRPVCQTSTGEYDSKTQFSMNMSIPGLSTQYCGIYAIGSTTGPAVFSIDPNSSVDYGVAPIQGFAAYATGYPKTSAILTTSDSAATTLVADISRGPDAWIVWGDSDSAQPGNICGFHGLDFDSVVFGLQTATSPGLQAVSC